MPLLKNLITAQQLQKADVQRILSSAQEMERALLDGKPPVPTGKIAATLFFEPSTRTHSSFAASALRLGCQVLPFNASNSSLEKGESFSDTIRMLDSYADVLIIRHPQEGSAQAAAAAASHPVINAGDGGNEHPSQALIDLYTILKLKKSVQGLNVTLCGDLKYSRAMRSLFYLLGMFGANISLAAPKGLEMEPSLVQKVHSHFGAQTLATQTPRLEECDVLYVCRIQKERFPSAQAATAAQSTFRITPSLLRSAKKGMAILHPLPKLDELPAEVDSSPHAQYFHQAKNAVPVRMAIIKEVLRISFP